MEDKGQIYGGDNAGQSPTVQEQIPADQGQITPEAVHDENIQVQNINADQTVGAQNANTLSDEKAVDKLISLGVILLAVSLAITFLYLFSSTNLVNNITSYF